MNEICDTVTNKVGSGGLSPPNSQSVIPNSIFPDKVSFQFFEYYYEPSPYKLKIPPNAVDLAMDLLLSRPANTV